MGAWGRIIQHSDWLQFCRITVTALASTKPAATLTATALALAAATALFPAEAAATLSATALAEAAATATALATSPVPGLDAVRRRLQECRTEVLHAVPVLRRHSG